MPRTFTLFTGQWADLPFERSAGWPPAGATTAWRSPCWGDHLDASGAGRGRYVGAGTTAGTHGLKVWAISNHLVGQAVCDHPIDFRHQAIFRRRSGATANRKASGSGRPRR